jgi:predicted helicase
MVGDRRGPPMSARSGNAVRRASKSRAAVPAWTRLALRQQSTRADVTKRDIFDYVDGLLYRPQYRERYAEPQESILQIQYVAASP